MEIKDRKKKILEAIIKDYINYAEPIGSRTLSKRHSLGISPATIRNEMADLEDLGFLIQPHTSSGRIPTQQAYRYYVDEIMQIQKLTEVLRNDIHSGYLNSSIELHNTMDHTAQVLSTLTNYTSVVLAPRFSRFNCKHVQVIPLIRKRILLIVVTMEGIAKNIEMSLSEEINMMVALRLSNALNSLMKNIAFQEMGVDLVYQLKELSDFETKMLQEILPILKAELLAEVTEIHSGGVTNLFNYPEFSNVERIKNLLSVMGEKQVLGNLLRTKAEDSTKLTIHIGDENKEAALKELSIITTTYEVNGEVIGALGIIGPTRMDYDKVGSVLEYIRTELNNNIKKLLSE